MDNANSTLNRIFTRNTFRQIIEDGHSPAYTAAIRRYVVDGEDKTNRECISEIYSCLRKAYQNEYYYKNTLLNKLLLGIHSIKTTTALTEVPIGGSKADFILINGKAVVYEIKTALDNFERLDGQIEDYYKAFTRVTVVTAEEHYEEIQRKLAGRPVGICILTRRGNLSLRKEPEEYTDKLSKTTMFKILRKEEHEVLLQQQFGALPDTSQFEYYRKCQSEFESIPTDIAYKLFIQILKQRSKIEIEEYAKIPYELKFLAYFSNYKRGDYSRLFSFLDN